MLDSNKVKSALSQGREAFSTLVRDVVDDHTTEECEKAFREALEIGIENSIRSMVAVSAANDAMVSALNNVWGMTRKEAAERIVWAKREIAIERLDEMLALKGMSSREIEEFHSVYDVRGRIHHSEELFGYWDDPECLCKKIVEMGKSREKPILLHRRF